MRLTSRSRHSNPPSWCWRNPHRSVVLDRNRRHPTTKRDARGKHKISAHNWSISRSEEHTSELQSHSDLVCRLLLEKKSKILMSPRLVAIQYCNTTRIASRTRSSPAPSSPV